jgi:hypothetical protein
MLVIMLNQMKKIIFLFLILNSIIIISHAQELPLGYILQYSQDFSDKNAVADFNFSNPDSWKIVKQNNNSYLEFSEQSNYFPLVGCPNIIGLLSGQMYSDFILEADIMQTGEDNDLRNTCIIVSLKDSTHYYYIHLALKADENSNNVFLVNDTIRTKTGIKISKGINWINDKWNKVRVERDILKKTITVYINDMLNPVMVAKDRTLIMGYIGFGSIDTPGKIDNIKIWAPTFVPGETNIFDKIPVPDN